MRFVVVYPAALRDLLMQLFNAPQQRTFSGQH